MGFRVCRGPEILHLEDITSKQVKQIKKVFCLRTRAKLKQKSISVYKIIQYWKTVSQENWRLRVVITLRQKK